MVGDDNQTSAGFQHLQRLLQHLTQSTHFIIHLDTQGLKYLSQEFLLLIFSRKGLYHFQKVGDRFYLLRFPAAHQDGSQLACHFQFSVKVEQVGQLFFRICINNIRSSLSSPGIHPHIQRSVETEREPAILVIKMMGRNAQVGQQPIDLTRYTMITHEVI